MVDEEKKISHEKLAEETEDAFETAPVVTAEKAKLERKNSRVMQEKKKDKW